MLHAFDWLKFLVLVGEWFASHYDLRGLVLHAFDQLKFLVLVGEMRKESQLRVQPHDSGGGMLDVIYREDRESWLLEKNLMKRVDGTWGARMGVVWEERSQLAVGNNHLVPLGTQDVQLQHPHQAKVRRECIGEQHHAFRWAVHRKGSRDMGGHSICKECIQTGPREIGPCQRLVCIGFHLKIRNRALRRGGR